MFSTVVAQVSIPMNRVLGLRVPLDKRSDLVLWEDLEGAGGEGGGSGDRDGEDM